MYAEYISECAFADGEKSLSKNLEVWNNVLEMKRQKIN